MRQNSCFYRRHGDFSSRFIFFLRIEKIDLKIYFASAKLQFKELYHGC